METMQDRMLARFKDIIEGKEYGLDILIKWQYANKGVFFVQRGFDFNSLIICKFWFTDNYVELKFDVNVNKKVEKSFMIEYKDGNKINAMFDWFNNQI